MVAGAGRGKRPRNPLTKRLPRELLGEAGKYAVIFLLLVASIGFVSGFLVADNSMIAAYNAGFADYNIEDGHFRVENRLNKARRAKLETAGAITLYDLFYTEQALQNGSKLRIYPTRGQVNLACLMAGALPGESGQGEQAENTQYQIAIDRMYADNNGLTVGDTLPAADGTEWVITGLVALSDYSCLFENNSDTMFDAVQFGVAIVTPEAFDALLARQKTDPAWCYAWKYNTQPVDEAEEHDAADALMKTVNAEAPLLDFVPRTQNQAITFTGEDMGSDKAMMIALLYIIIAIMAFVFGVTIRNTVQQEAAVIGTLRATGYTKGELVRHYMAVPLLVTLAGAAVGNLLGYTVMKEVCAGMYYGSYSLPTYVTLWNTEAFWLTTAVPLALMALITFCTLWRVLGLAPLRFLRRDLRRHSRRRALPLPGVLPFFSRFRLRVILQNLGSYLVLFAGILFANLLLMFGMGLPKVLAHYQTTLTDNLLANYQYLLQLPYDALDEEHKVKSLLAMLEFTAGVQTDNPDAEKFTAYELKTTFAGSKTEDVLLYGVAENSRYIPLDFAGLEAQDGQVYISSALAEKFTLAAGDTITLKEEYDDTTYTFTVCGVYDYIGALALFMPQAALNRTFDLDADYFSGYFSDSEITDIDAASIGSVIDLTALTKISRQLDVSMGSMMGLVDGFAVLIFAVVIYLLSKMMIEKNAQSISMAKILGYSNGEIARLYLLSTTVVVAVCIVASFPILAKAMVAIFRTVLLDSISGWIPLYLDPVLYRDMFVLGFAVYAAVALVEYGRIRRIPMEEALKNVE